MAVIKANAYGHGLETAAAALADADGLAVARVEEALALRAAGSRHRILLLEGVSRAEQLEVAARDGFDVMIHSFEQLVMLEQRPHGATLRTWIKLDTGMNRLGFRVEEFAGALARLVRISGVAPDPDDRDAPGQRGRSRRPEDAAAARLVRGGDARTAGRAQRREFGGDPRLARVAWRLGAPGADALRRLPVSSRLAARTSACGR